MITARLYRDGVLREERFDPLRISDVLGEGDAEVWLDVADPSAKDLRLIQEEFGLHPLAIEDAEHRNQRPKVETYEGFFFVVLYSLGVDGDGTLTESEIHAFAGPRFLITIRFSPLFDLAPVIRRWDLQPELTSEGGAFLLYALLDEVVDGYFDVVERFEDDADDVEGRVFGDEPDPGAQEAIFRLKRRVVDFRRRVMPLREVLDLLGGQPRFVTDRLAPYYRDVADHVIRTLEFADNIREVLTAALEAQISQISNRLNEVMKRLTSWAAIILVPTLIAGIYGMNFRFMPELDWRLGYAFALGLMLLSGLVLFRVFKRRDWL
ncbi:MAG: magnesium/cobalt transporter CorA [Actinobacteria bacterium]|nr:magnesium/cobalt transporter CorA [Actinomycetota bacterium]